MSMGERLKTLRLERRMTQKQIADRLGVAISAVSSYEADQRYPSYDSLVKLADIYYVSTDYLIGRTASRNIDVEGLEEEDLALISQLISVLRKRKIKPDIEA